MSTGTDRPANRLHGPHGMRGPRQQRGGFTLVELLAVIVILGMLIGLIAPSVQAIRKMFLADQTKAYMHQLSMGIDNYRTEIGDLPPSDGSYPHPANLNPPKLSSGAAGLVQCLMGYMGSTMDGLAGPGFRVERAGKKHGPFVPQQMPLAGDPPVFQDAFGNSILYYRFSAAGKSYNTADNSTTDAKGPSNLMTYVRDWSPGDSTHPYYREDYILISPGPDREWVTQVTSTTTKVDDIANFSFHIKEIQP